MPASHAQSALSIHAVLMSTSAQTAPAALLSAASGEFCGSCHDGCQRLLADTCCLQMLLASCHVYCFCSCINHVAFNPNCCISCFTVQQHIFSAVPTGGTLACRDALITGPPSLQFVTYGASTSVTTDYRVAAAYPLLPCALSSNTTVS